MINLIRQSPHRLRFWITAAAAILLLMSVLEAGHAHGVFTTQDDHCVLCQHSVALEKTLLQTHAISISFLLNFFGFAVIFLHFSDTTFSFAQIRAPPVNLHRQ